jgi:hypothetical protein
VRHQGERGNDNDTEAIMKDVEIVMTLRTAILSGKGSRDHYVSKHVDGETIMPARSQNMTAFQLRHAAQELLDLADVCDQMDGLIQSADDMRRGLRNVGRDGEVILEFEK